MSTLAIVGAGPKAMALVAKAAALAELGFAVPHIHVIERTGIGANWTGDAGYTNGRQPLGTSADKDVGFPYASTCWGREHDAAIDAAMLKFSWTSFLVAHGGFADWNDRGRPAPEHGQWARYLRWVGGLAANRFTLHHGALTGIDLDGARWRLTYAAAAGGAPTELVADGLMLTGPGQVALTGDIPRHERIVTVETFWPRFREIADAGNACVAIVGAGETAAAIALALVQHGASGLDLAIVSPLGMAYSRGESFRENRVYSDPAAGNWGTLTPAHRRDFIRRTDRGVFSQHATKLLDHAQNLEIIAGRLEEVSVGDDGRPALAVRYGDAPRLIRCDWAVLATGADPTLALRQWLTPAAQAALLAGSRLADLSAAAVEGAIQYDLSLRGPGPKLYLPMLAGFAQGPGFPNLSSLGRLSDRVLEAWARPAGVPTPILAGEA